MSNTPWPVDKYGKPLKMRDMTPEQRKQQWKEAAVKALHDVRKALAH